MDPARNRSLLIACGNWREEAKRTGVPRRRFVWLALALGIVAWSIAPAAEPLARWSFDDSLEGLGTAGERKPIEGRGNLAVQGYAGKSLEPGPDGVTYALPEAAVATGSLSFWYREPVRPEPKAGVVVPATPLLRLGKATLTVETGRFVWRGEKEEDREPSSQYLPIRGKLSDWRLLEIAWGPEGTRVFVNGLLHSTTQKPKVAPVTPQTFSLLNGDFDEMVLGKDPAEAGARFEGVIYAENFENDPSPRGWSRGVLGGAAATPERVAGAVGSKWAFGMLHPMVKPYLQFNVPGVVLTEETRICLLLRSTLPKASLCAVSTSNHWIQRTLEPETWTPVRLTFQDLKMQPGELLRVFVFNHSTAEEISLALDNFAVIRGEKLSRPSAPADLVAQRQGDAVRLSWGAAMDEGGVAGYRIYRGEQPDFPVDEKHEIGRTLDIVFVDGGLKGGALRHYKVAAEDFLGQLGPASTPASPR